MKVTVTIEKGEQVFTATAEEPSLDEAVSRAASLAKLEARRKPGCTCDMARLSEDRCSSGIMRCNGSIAECQKQKRAQHGDNWWEKLPQ